jgi:hypothetical protein
MSRMRAGSVDHKAGVSHEACESHARCTRAATLSWRSGLRRQGDCPGPRNECWKRRHRRGAHRGQHGIHRLFPGVPLARRSDLHPATGGRLLRLPDGLQQDRDQRSGHLQHRQSDDGRGRQGGFPAAGDSLRTFGQHLRSLLPAGVYRVSTPTLGRGAGRGHRGSTTTTAARSSLWGTHRARPCSRTCCRAT